MVWFTQNIFTSWLLFLTITFKVENPDNEILWEDH